jgi:thiamine biosynthesis lipoprotein ApbE
MKKFWIVACLFATLPISALAASGTKSKTVTLGENVQVAGKDLKPGDYKLKWQEDGSDTANVAIYDSNNKEVATSPAHIIHEKNTSHASYEVDTASGANKLDRVYLSNEVLDFGSAPTPGM